jgi:hypothetical protein
MIETISPWRSVPCSAKLPTPDSNCLRPGSTAISSRLIFLVSILKFYPLCPFLHRRPTSKCDDSHMQRIADDRELYGGLIRLHVLHHANEKPLYGQWMIEELQHHGYRLDQARYIRSYIASPGRAICGLEQNAAEAAIGASTGSRRQGEGR